MDLAVLKQCALTLREKLEEFTGDDDVDTLAEELEPMLDQAIAGELVELVELEDFPGLHMFDDGIFEDYEGLEEAYVSFRAEATGGAEFEFDDEDEEE